jgi:hypothetical protein
MASYAEFQERWEEEAGKEREHYDSLPITDLLEDIRQRKPGEYYQIWYSLKGRAKLEEVGWSLYDFLQSGEDYLFRYHCAAALIAIAGLDAKGYRPEHLSARPAHPVDERLQEVYEFLESQLGKRE